MDRMLRIKLENILRTESTKTMEEKMDLNDKINKMNDLFNLKKILDNYDELQPIISEYLNNKAWKEKFEREESGK